MYMSCGGVRRLFAAHLCKRANSIPSLQPTDMSSVTPQRFDNNGPQPYLVILREDYTRWLEYHPDGRRVVIGSYDGTLRVWNLESEEQEGTWMNHGGEISGLAMARGGTKVISSGDDGRIKVWDIESHELVKEWTHPESCPNIAISPDDRLVVGRKNVGIYTTEGRQVNHSIEVGDSVWSMCFSPEGNKLACATTDDIRVYDVNSGRLIAVLSLNGDWVVDVVWSRDGGRLFASEGRTIRCWNTDTGQQIGHPWTGHTDNIFSLSLSPDGSTLASASWDRTVRFWNATTGNPVGQRLQHDNGVYVVRFSPSGEFAASAGWNRVCLWRVPWLNPAESQVSTLIRCT